MESGSIISWQIDGEKVEREADFIFMVFKITADGDCSDEIKSAAMKWKDTCSLEEKQTYDKPRWHRPKKHRHHFADKGLYS